MDVYNIHANTFRYWHQLPNMTRRKLKMSLREIAKATTAGSPVMTGRTKIQTEEVIKRFPAGIHLNGIDMINSKDGTVYPVFTFTENDEVFYSGGKMLTDIALKWVDDLGSVEAVSEELQGDPVGIKLALSKTKKGRDLTTVEII